VKPPIWVLVPLSEDQFYVVEVETVDGYEDSARRWRTGEVIFGPAIKQLCMAFIERRERARVPRRVQP
jgi:hypothetical protein